MENSMPVQERELLSQKSYAELKADYRALGLVYYTPSEEKANAFTHFAGAVIGLVEMLILLLSVSGAKAIAASVLIGFGTIFTYFVSGVYHSLKDTRRKALCRRFDHAGVSTVVFSCAVALSLGLTPSVFNWFVLGFGAAVCLFNYAMCVTLGQKWFRFANALELIMSGLFTASFFVNFAEMSLVTRILYACGGFSCLFGFMMFGRKKRYTHTVFHVLMTLGTTFCFVAEYFILTGNTYFLFPADSAVWEVLLDALKDSAIIFAVAFGVNLIVPFIEPKMSGKLNGKSKVAPFLGVCFGLIPQCGFSVVATDMYQKRHITVGTLLGIYIATSDEALPIFLANTSNPDKILMALPLLLIKFFIGLFVGYAVDFVCTRSRGAVDAHMEHCEHAPSTHVGCCGHEIEGKDESKLESHFLHPLKHSLKLFAYVLIVEIIFGFVLYAVGEDALVSFLGANRYVAPLAAVAIGLIPNCVSSVVLSELYLLGGLGFGACLGGLCVNSGIALLYLFKDVKHTKTNLLILLTLVLVSITAGYVTSFAFQFR